MQRFSSRYFIFVVCILFLDASAPSYAQNSLPKKHPKYKTARKVFDNLVRAVGDGRTKPRLLLLPNDAPSRMKVAWFRPEQNTVTIEERVYDLCLSLGADSLNAVASLLGHELAHYYKGHGWVGDFGNSFADLEVGQTLKKLKLDMSKKVEIETEADYFGGFFGYVAGYNTLGAAPRVLQQVYSEYELGENIPGYPSLPERQEIAKRSAEKLHKMLPIFAGGNRLMLVGQYEEAARCFDFIARDFSSREILNNTGVARILNALSLYGEGEIRFAYPVEVDAETRLSGESKADEMGYYEENMERIEQLLAEAGESFDEAIKKDPNYATAYVNLACVKDLQEEADDAVFYAQKAAKIARKNDEKISLANAHIILGIAQANSDPAADEAARQAFEAAKDGNTPLALLNLSALDLEAMAYAEKEDGEKSPPKREKIDGIGFAQIYDAVTEAPDASAKLPKAGRGQPAINFYSRETENWSGLVIDTSYKAISFLEVRKGYAGKTGRDIVLGSNRGQVLEAYGRPAKMVAGRQGLYHLYEQGKIIFQTDAEDKVQTWMIYSIE